MEGNDLQSRFGHAHLDSFAPMFAVAGNSGTEQRGRKQRE